MPKNLKIQYFALLRDQRGQSSEELDTESTTSRELYQELSDLHSFTLPDSALKIAINDDFASWDDTLNDGDSIVFIPPVAGG